MTWLYLPPAPSTPSLSVPASEASNSDYSLLTAIADRLSEASCTSKGKLLPSPAWSRRWKRGGYILRLSGLTLEPSTADRFADAWISSLRATRAKEIALPESAAANSTTAGCSIAPSTSSIKAGLQPSSARTCRGTLTGNSPSLSRHWSDWAAALRSEYSARPKPAIRCAGSDSSSWPSARTSDTNGAGLHGDGGMDLRTAASEWMAPVSDDTGTRTKRYGQGGMALSMQATVWAGPKASDPEKAGPNMRGSKGDIPLPAQAMRWPGPRVSAANGYGNAERGLDGGNCRLEDTAALFHPPSSPAQPIIAAGSMSSTDTPNSNQPSVKRKLNPIFVEALMRWPTGLSGFVRPEMALIQWQQQQLSFVSMLCSQPEQAQMEMF